MGFSRICLTQDFTQVPKISVKKAMRLVTTVLSETVNRTIGVAGATVERTATTSSVGERPPVRCVPSLDVLQVSFTVTSQVYWGFSVPPRTVPQVRAD